MVRWIFTVSQPKGGVIFFPDWLTKMSRATLAISIVRPTPVIFCKVQGENRMPASQKKSAGG
jgi:hypothetical protein